MLAQRLVTAAVGIPVILAVILIGGPLYTAVAAVILALAALELMAALEPVTYPDAAHRPLWQPRAVAIPAVAGAGALAIAADAGFDEWSGVFVLAVGAAFLVLIPLGDPQSGLRDWVSIVATLAYVGVLGSYLVLLRQLPDGAEWVLLAVLGTWAADTFAYFTGKLTGRRKLAPKISPGKTVEGTIGGIVGGFVSVIVIAEVLGLPVNTSQAALLALLLPAVAVVADLGESMIKRGAHVKDSSTLVPGHGGILDRMDSILFTVPLVYYFAIWVAL